MKIQIFLVALIAIIIGIICGALIVFVITVQRRNQRVDSLVSAKNVVGLFATVMVPFDKTCKGKVQVNIQGATVDFSARTDDPNGFEYGERVFIVETRKNLLWVVSENSLDK
ncbi:MAG: NfeD-like protein [Mastigocoleus sp.]